MFAVFCKQKKKSPLKKPIKDPSAHLHLRGAPGIQQDGFHLADVSDVPVQARAALADKRAQGVGRPLGICEAKKKSTVADAETVPS